MVGGDTMIDRNDYFKSDKQSKILVSNILDKYKAYQKYGKSTCTNFLNPCELHLVTSCLNHYHIPYHIYEPYSFMEKKILYFGEYQDFITFYQISVIGPSNLSHSAILGSLFAIGFQENTIGDIFIQDGICYYMNLTRLNTYLEENLIRVGKQSVILEKINQFHLSERTFELFTILTHSMRIDSIISRITSKSRNQVKQMFLDRGVFLNYQEFRNQNILLKEGDVLSIRKVGKFKIGKQQGQTKKENIILEVYRYK